MIGQQLEQVQQPLEVQQAGMAVQLQLLLTVAGGADAAVEARELTAQEAGEIALMGGLHRHHRGKALRPPRPEGLIRQAGGHAPDHRRGHGPLPLGVPAQARAQRCEEPPADPLHRPRQRQVLGDRQPPGPLGVGGIHDHRHAGRHRTDQPLMQPLLDRRPGALHRRIAEHLSADRIGGEHHRRLPLRPCKQRGEGQGGGGLAAGGRADQQVTAQGLHSCRVQALAAGGNGAQPTGAASSVLAGGFSGLGSSRGEGWTGQGKEQGCLPRSAAALLCQSSVLLPLCRPRGGGARPTGPPRCW
jgi:hypothetical protein